MGVAADLYAVGDDGVGADGAALADGDVAADDGARAHEGSGGDNGGGVDDGGGCDAADGDMGGIEFLRGDGVAAVGIVRQQHQHGGGRLCGVFLAQEAQARARMGELVDVFGVIEEAHIVLAGAVEGGHVAEGAGRIAAFADARAGGRGKFLRGEGPVIGEKAAIYHVKLRLIPAN